MHDDFVKEFKLRDDLIYLNHAGVSPWPLRTVQAVQCYAEENMLQGSYNYPGWLKIETELRTSGQKLLNASSIDDIALLKNTSEALSVVAYGLDWKEGDNIVSSNEEFPSNRIVWESLSERGVEFRQADLFGSVTPEDALFSLVDSRTRLITVSSIQFSTGLKMDLKRIGEFCREQNILYCVDAIQSIGAVRFDVKEIHADFVMADGHKWMLGPEGLSLFYCSPDMRKRLKLNQYGWHMVEALGDFERRDWIAAKSARRFECGSQNMIGIHALNASLSLLLEAGMERVEHAIVKRSELLFELIKSTPGADLISSTEPGRYAGIVTFRLQNADQDLLYRHMTENNVVCALRGGGIRLSPHFYTPFEKLNRFIEVLMEFRH